jgi:zinc D-Ala-D-Ala carboxypeptidase|tara:strand:+ start:858 stop:1301 length:444 start_codon:yes stop_codon:yes gene_type:complete
MMLSDHFSLAEFTKSQTAIRKGIKNDPNDAAIENMRLLCENILEPVRQHYDIPFTLNSGFRCLALNEAVGSSSRSQHVTGQAADFEIPTIANKDLAHWIMDNLDYDQVLLEFYKEGDPSSGWVHCSYDNGNNRKQAKKFDGRTWETL